MKVQGIRSMGIAGIALSVSVLVYFVFQLIRIDSLWKLSDLLPVIVSIIILIISIFLLNNKLRIYLSYLYGYSDVILGSFFLFIIIYDLLFSSDVIISSIVNIVFFLLTVIAGVLFLVKSQWHKKYLIPVCGFGLLMGLLVFLAGIQSLYIALSGSLMPEIGLSLGKFFLLISMMIFFYYGNHLLLVLGKFAIEIDESKK